MIRDLGVELVDAAGADIGEGPSWDKAADCLVWVDITAGAVHLTEEDGTRRCTFLTSNHVGAALPALGGGWLLAIQSGFAVLSQKGIVELLANIEPGGPERRLNDAKCDGVGRAWAGTMAYEKTPGAGTLYRLDAAPKATAVLDAAPKATAVLAGLTISNGMGWSPDHRTFYFIDSASHAVSAFPYDIETGTLGSPQVLAEIPSKVGMPDGMCVDEAGCLWVALWGGGVVHRYTPGGVLDTIVTLPVTQVTSCAFGGTAGNRLYITSAARGLTADQRSRQPLAGGLFAVHTGASGAAATPWRLDR